LSDIQTQEYWLVNSFFNDPEKMDMIYQVCLSDCDRLVLWGMISLRLPPVEKTTRMESAKYLDFHEVGEANMNPTKSDEPLLTGYVLNK
jgi:hypothetical protein